MRTATRNAQAGMGLIELMIALTITAVILVIVFGSFFRSQRAAGTVMGRVDSRQSMRAAMQLLERDMRMAGSGWGRIDVQGAANGAPLTLHCVNIGYGGTVAGNDSISIIGGWEASTNLSAAMLNTGANIDVLSTTGFASGDMIVITNGASAHLFKCTSVSTSPNRLGHATTSTYNAAGGHLAWPASGYGIGARVFKVRWITYRTDSTQIPGSLSLVRYELGQTPKIAAPAISGFQVSYRMDDGSTLRNPVNFLSITQIVPVVRLRDATGRAALDDSIWAAIRPRTF